MYLCNTMIMLNYNSTVLGLPFHSQMLASLPVRRRIVLTGTPIQVGNDLPVCVTCAAVISE